MSTAWNSAGAMETLPSRGDTAAERDLDRRGGSRDVSLAQFGYLEKHH